MEILMSSKNSLILTLSLLAGFPCAELIAMKTEHTLDTLNFGTIKMVCSEQTHGITDAVQHTISLHIDQATIGSISFVYMPVTKEGCIRFLKIQKPYRKNGLGKELMQEALSKLATVDCEKISLCACPSKKKYLNRLVSFYEQFDFHVDEDGISKESNSAVMEKFLHH